MKPVVLNVKKGIVDEEARLEEKNSFNDGHPLRSQKQIYGRLRRPPVLG